MGGAGGASPRHPCHTWNSSHSRQPVTSHVPQRLARLLSIPAIAPGIPQNARRPRDAHYASSASPRVWKCEKLADASSEMAGPQLQNGRYGRRLAFYRRLLEILALPDRNTLFLARQNIILPAIDFPSLWSNHGAITGATLQTHFALLQQMRPPVTMETTTIPMTSGSSLFWL